MFETTETNEGTRYTLPGNNAFYIPTPDAITAESAAGKDFTFALKMVGEFADHKQGIEVDPTLSPVGRAQKIEPLTSVALQVVATQSASLDTRELQLKDRESALLAVPALDYTHAAVAVEDREIRDYWRSQTPQQRTELMKKIDAETGHERLMIALMRSPIPQLDHEVAFVRAVWDRTKRLENPSEAIAIEDGRAAINWARRGLVNAAGIAVKMSGWPTTKILSDLVSTDNPQVTGGASVYGFSALDVERAKAMRKTTLTHGKKS